MLWDYYICGNCKILQRICDEKFYHDHATLSFLAKIRAFNLRKNWSHLIMKIL